VGATVPRDQLWSVQTPQGFPYQPILEAHRKAVREGVDTLTDDAAAAEYAGIGVRVVMGEARNIKLTTAEDLAKAQSASQRNDIRTGQGIDFHVFETGKQVILGGVAIPHSHKLKGHSDADVVLHAITDALLGSIGEGDIGTFFPPSDMQWKNADSKIFVEKAIELLRARNGIVANIDVTILAEEPKITPHIKAMKTCISSLCKITADRVAVKATTTEKMGSIGRKEGIAAFALATIRLP
jgi:2-C-methyl-D-erythritol 4-phosphate cytidylyltransferase / 2-C-methyl-D-erythritol 2,4-cyclodiphosphate synthase